MIELALAFVLLNVEPGGEDEIRATLSKLDEVIESHTVYGTYDMVVRLTSETLDDIKKIVTGKIRKLDKVRSTLTMLVVEQP
ncbi:MAG: Lrp/AsnC family transcriptional regulator [Candidatus Geothermarchaeales archaeon]